MDGGVQRVEARAQLAVAGAPDGVGVDDGGGADGRGDGLLGGGEDAAGHAAEQRGAVGCALLDGEPGLIWTYRGEVRMAFAFTVLDGHVTDVELIADPARLAGMGVEPLP